MPDPSSCFVINTTPLIALAIGMGNLEVLRVLYQGVFVPLEVEHEILALGESAPGAREFIAAPWLHRLSAPQVISTYLRNSLDRGEAAVIQAALNLGIQRVCIDERVGRRVARLNGLTLTGSIGVLIKARQRGYPVDGMTVIERLREHGIWLGQDVTSLLMQEN